MRALRYSLDEALLSLWRGRRSGVLSMATIALALFVLGVFLMVTANFERLGAEWSRAAELSVYLNDDVSPAERADVEKLIAVGPVVAGVEFVSKTEALTRFKATFSDLAETVDSLDGGNPLPASYEVKLTPESHAAGAIGSLAETLRATSGVADVRYDREWLDRMLAAIGWVKTAGVALGALLGIAAALTVANVVRLALHARREEITIMQLVGAPTAFVRGPFVMEGVLQGGLGALLAVAALALAFLVSRDTYLAPAAAAINLSAVRFLSAGWCLALVAGGMAVGCLGGVLASGRVSTVTQS
jgi:cell division transport system permease protein